MSLKRKNPAAEWSNYIHTVAASLREQDSTPNDDRDKSIPENSSHSCTSSFEQCSLSCLWNLPDTILFGIVSFVAAPTNRASVVCHQLAPLNRLCYNQFQNNTILWEAILQEDYGAARECHGASSITSRRNQAGGSDHKRRRCTRLERSPLEQVKEAHRLVKDNTEIAFYYLSELVTASTKKSGLSHRKLVGLLHEYGPHLRINQRTYTGGLFLIEVCRSKNVNEAVILKCVRELVEKYGAIVDLQTYEAASAYQTALAVASARGMPTIVKYLLSKGASPDILSSGRFQLSKNSKKTMRLTNSKSLDFAKEARRCELEHGATARELKNLNDCIELLEASATTNTLIEWDYSGTHTSIE
ncbi:hypothetical protein MPSEU_000226900 [Mayamaea pseudoterrestris]|nr:hypothetical protein MPSEU_000226900 [Mayamaea pseudoterrestris]